MPKAVTRKPKPKSELQKKLKSQGIKKPQPLWKGPDVDGITQSLLNLFLICRERFRIRVVDGFVPHESFRSELEYGNMFHLCEENPKWEKLLAAYVKELYAKYPMDKEHISKWYSIIHRQYPVYRDHWKKTDKDLESLAPETEFRVPIELKINGETIVVYLRGKFDDLELLVRKKTKKLYLKENKIQGNPEQDKLEQRLHFDLQTMFYLYALRVLLNASAEEFASMVPGLSTSSQKKLRGKLSGIQLGGVNYNVIRRPLSGGRHSIKQHQPTKKNPKGESLTDFYNRLGGLIDGDRDFFFFRWRADVTDKDITFFETRFLRPVLSSLCLWWNSIKDHPFDPFRSDNYHHWILPYGIYNPITAPGRGGTIVDTYLFDRNYVGLSKSTNLFPELAAKPK